MSHVVGDVVANLLIVPFHYVFPSARPYQHIEPASDAPITNAAPDDLHVEPDVQPLNINEHRRPTEFANTRPKSDTPSHFRPPSEPVRPQQPRRVVSDVPPSTGSRNPPMSQNPAGRSRQDQPTNYAQRQGQSLAPPGRRVVTMPRPQDQTYRWQQQQQNAQHQVWHPPTPSQSSTSTSDSSSSTSDSSDDDSEEPQKPVNSTLPNPWPNGRPMIHRDGSSESEARKIDEWRAYPAFPSAYPNTPVAPRQVSMPVPMIPQKLAAYPGYHVPPPPPLPGMSSASQQAAAQRFKVNGNNLSSGSGSDDDEDSSSDEHVDFDKTLRTPHRSVHANVDLAARNRNGVSTSPGNRDPSRSHNGSNTHLPPNRESRPETTGQAHRVSSAPITGPPRNAPTRPPNTVPNANLPPPNRTQPPANARGAPQRGRGRGQARGVAQPTRQSSRLNAGPQGPS